MTRRGLILGLLGLVPGYGAVRAAEPAKPIVAIPAGWRRVPGYQRYDGRPNHWEARPVPGVGPVQQAYRFNGRTYAVRSDGRTPVMYKTSMEGWVKVSD